MRVFSSLIVTAIITSSAFCAELRFSADWESGKFPPKGSDSINQGPAHSEHNDRLNNLTISGEFARRGKYSIQINQTREDAKALPLGKGRAELSKGNFDFALGKEYWIGISYFFPHDFQFDVFDPHDRSKQNADIILQLHGRSNGPGYGSTPPFSVQVHGDKLCFRIAKDRDVKRIEGVFQYLGTLKRGVWHDVVIRLKQHYENGYAEGWLNGVKTVSYQGPTIYHSKTTEQTRDVGTYLKIGLYKANWNKKSRQSNVTRRNFYLDELRVAEGDNGFAIVDPSFGER